MTKANIIIILSKQSSVRDQCFFPYHQVVHGKVIYIKKNQINFLKIWKMSFCLGSYLKKKSYFNKTLNMLRSLISKKNCVCRKVIRFHSTGENKILT